MIDRFTDADWRAVSRKLKLAGERWWEDHREELVGLGIDEARDLFAALKKGKRRQAKLELVARMTPEEWVTYRDGTTAELRDIASRRAKMLAALEELGWLASRIIGHAALSVLR